MWKKTASKFAKTVSALLLTAGIMLGNMSPVKAGIMSIDYMTMALNTAYSETLGEKEVSDDDINVILDIQELYAMDGKTLLMVYIPGNYLTENHSDSVEKALDKIHKDCETIYNASYMDMMTYVTKDMTVDSTDKIVIEKFKLKNKEAAEKYIKEIPDETQKSFHENVLGNRTIDEEMVEYIRHVTGTPVEKYDTTKDMPVTVKPVPSPVYDDDTLYTAVSEAISSGPTTNAAIDSDVIATAMGTDIADNVKAVYEGASGAGITITLTKDNAYRDRELCPAGTYELKKVSPLQYKNSFPKTIDVKGDTEVSVSLPEVIREKDIARYIVFAILLIISFVYIIALTVSCVKDKKVKKIEKKN